MARLLVLGLGAVALAALCFICVRNHAVPIQNDIQTRVSTTLNDAGYQFAGLSVDGRDVILTGTAPSEEVRTRAAGIARAVRGVRVLDNQIEVVDVAAVEEQQIEEANTCQADFNQLLTAENIRFRSGSAELLTEGVNLLNQMSAVAANCPAAAIEIAGHTDSIGGTALNQNLSQLRADAVRQYLINQGIDAERLTAVGYGETAPIATNRSAAGRAQNRRIEFRVQGLE